MEIKDQDILIAFENREIDVLIHQCNCFHVWGKGLAPQIKRKYPTAYDADLATVCGDKYKVGQFSLSIINDNQIIINLYGQYTYGKGKQTIYPAIINGFQNIKKFLSKMGMDECRIGIPYKIGCGNGGGDWKIVSGIIKKEFDYLKNTLMQVILYRYEPRS